RFFTDSSGGLGVFTLSDGSILLRKLPSGEELDRLNLNGKEPATLCQLSQDGQQLVSLHMQKADQTQTSVRLWTRGPDDHWAESGRIAVPHADNVGMLDGKPFVCSYDETAHVYKVVDLTTQKVIDQLEHVPSWVLAAGSPGSGSSGFL